MMMVELLCGVLGGPPALFGKDVRPRHAVVVVAVMVRIPARIATRIAVECLFGAVEAHLYVPLRTLVV